MPRIRPLEPPYRDEVQHSFDAIMKGREPLVLFRTIATSERAWTKFRGASLLDRGPLALKDREIVIDRTTALANCEYEWGVHVAIFAEHAGLSDEQVDATRNDSSDAPCWSDAERALISAVDALHARATLDRNEYDALRAHYDDAQVLEILMLCGFYRTVSYVANALDLPLEAGGRRFPASASQAQVAKDEG
jgi:alkylhydroperoxidase family enzyme